MLSLEFVPGSFHPADPASVPDELPTILPRRCQLLHHIVCVQRPSPTWASPKTVLKAITLADVQHYMCWLSGKDRKSIPVPLFMRNVTPAGETPFGLHVSCLEGLLGTMWQERHNLLPSFRLTKLTSLLLRCFNLQVFI